MNRREFLAGLGMGAAALGCGQVLGGEAAKFRLAMAGYTLYDFKALDALKECQRLGVKFLCVKDRHLPFNSTKAQIAEFKKMCADHGVTPYGVGPITMTSPAEARKFFDYAAALGVDLVVGVPGKQVEKGWAGLHSDRGMCEVCSKLADEYQMRFAIHNHGRNPKTGNPKLYPAMPETYELIKDLSPRMGFCVDWAYTYADRLDCREMALKYRDRIFDGHIRCISDMGSGSSACRPAERCFDYNGIFDALKSIGYAGCLGLEFKAAYPKHPEWIVESYDYFKKLM